MGIHRNGCGFCSLKFKKVGPKSSKTHYCYEGFVKSVESFFGQNKYTNIRRVSTLFCHKTRIFSVQKVQKIQFRVKWLHSIYLTKAKSRTLSLFTQNTKI